jgi:hypothetical protein
MQFIKPQHDMEVREVMEAAKLKDENLDLLVAAVDPRSHRYLRKDFSGWMVLGGPPVYNNSTNRRVVC